MTDFWDKARIAARSARALHELGDHDGAANRAYYAMLDAARAFLKAHDDPAVTVGRRHASTIERLSLIAVKTGQVDKVHGRALARAYERRAFADYAEESLDAVEAAALLEAMDGFLDAVGALLQGSTRR